MRLVSALMPTCHGPEFVERAIRCFEAQTYPCKELVVVADESHWLTLRDAGIREPMHVVPPGLSIGELRNIACRAARGSILAHWDDDDLSHPTRLERSVAAIDERADLVGSSLARYEEPATGRAWRWDGQHLNPFFLLGGTWVFRRRLWERWNFPDVGTGEDARLYWELQRMGARMTDLRDETLYTATIHPGNTSPKDTSSTGWEEIK